MNFSEERSHLLKQQINIAEPIPILIILLLVATGVALLTTMSSQTHSLRRSSANLLARLA